MRFPLGLNSMNAVTPPGIGERSASYSTTSLPPALMSITTGAPCRPKTIFEISLVVLAGDDSSGFRALGREAGVGLGLVLGMRASVTHEHASPNSAPDFERDRTQPQCR